MRALLITLGSAGDIHPFIAIGLALKQRGHEVTLMANDYFQDRIQSAGLGFWRVGTAAEYLEIIRQAGLVHGPLSPAFVLNHLILPAIRPYVETLRLIAQGGAAGTTQGAFRPDIVLTHHICFGVPEACEQLNIPCAIATLAPLMWLSNHEPLLLPGLPLEHPGKLIDWTLRRIMRPVARLQWDGPINAQLRRLDLPASRHHALRSGRGGAPLKARATKPCRPVLALWSPVFRPPLPDDPPKSVICGFCQFERINNPAQDRQLLQWMASHERPPILITLGSSVSHHGGFFYEISAQACTKLAHPAVLLTGGADVKNQSWPEHIRAVEYAPYSRAMPQASVIVHHAGIGTTAAALQAGRPAVIVPFANDEFDNAARVKRLGCGVTLKRRRLSPTTLAHAIRQVLDNPATTARCNAISQCLQEEDGPARAATELERIAHSQT